jgi:2-hydroxy-3-keto-5-methylthiopentenyl-1-phosphate phosphatase
MAGSGARPAILCDFDGTVTIEEVSVGLLKRYAAQEWERADSDLNSGRTSLRETMAREFCTLRAPREELECWVRTVRLRAGFRELVAEAKRREAPLAIASEGLDFYIEAFLAHQGIVVPFRTNHAVFTAGGICVEHPYSSPECDFCGTCKKALLAKFKSEAFTTVYVGDGISDRCPARYADMLFARGGLLEFCGKEGIPCVEYRDFFDVLKVLGQRFWGK